MSSDRPKTAEKFVDFFGVKSRNFFGTGLTLKEFLATHTAERIEQSWVIQPRDEQKRRLHFVMELSVELAKIKCVITFATALAEAAIEAIIEGDWDGVWTWAQHFTFEDEHEHIREQDGPVYRRFQELLVQAHETRPDAVKEKA